MDRYKRRGLNFQPGNDLQRELRAHRRSLDRRRSRQDVFDSTRLINDENAQILETVTEVEENTPAGSLSRHEMLKRWKEEKQLKKKLEAQKKAAKPVFKVCRVNHEQPSYLSSTKDPIPSDKRLTRAATKALAAPTMTLRSSKTPINSVGIQVTTKKRIEKVTVKASKIETEPRNSKEAKNKKLTKPNRFNDVSFAPANYEFVPIAGIAEYPQTIPLSPKTADSFLIPISTIEECVEVDEEGQNDDNGTVSSEIVSAEAVNEVLIAVSSEESVGEAPTEVEAPTEFKTPSNVVKKRVKISPLIYTSPFINREPRRSVLESADDAPIPLAFEDDLELQSLLNESAEKTKPDVSQFRSLLKTNTDHLTSLSNDWSLVLENKTSICESVVGRIRSAIGKANLLKSERFEQFSELVDDCELVRGEKVTTCDDLQGFWDMISIQVDEVSERFAKLDRIRQNGFEDEETPIKRTKLKKNLMTNKPKVNKTDNDDRSRAARQRLADFKAKAAAKLAAKLKRKSEVVPVDQLAKLSVASPSLPFTQTPSKTMRRSCSEVSASPATATRSAGRRTSLRHSILEKNFMDTSISLEKNEPKTSSGNVNRRSKLFSPLDSDPLPLSYQTVNLSPFESIDSPKRGTRRTDLIRFSDVHDLVDKENLQDSFSKYLEPSTVGSSGKK